MLRTLLVVACFPVLLFAQQDPPLEPTPPIEQFDVLLESLQQPSPTVAPTDDYANMAQADEIFRPLVFLSSQSEGHPLSCTGFYVKRDILMTAEHCVAPGTRQVALSGETFELELLARDPASDVAVFRTPRLSPFAYKIKRCCVKFGDRVDIVGLFNNRAPRGLAYMTATIANPLAKVFQNWNAGLIIDRGMIPGQSGSAILLDGQVVSVASGSGHPNSPYSRIGFGVPQQALKLIMKKAGL